MTDNNSCSIYDNGDNHEFGIEEHLGNTRTHKIFLKECIKCGYRIKDYENKKSGEVDYGIEIRKYNKR
jgi:hypothetical protein